MKSKILLPLLLVTLGLVACQPSAAPSEPTEPTEPEPSEPAEFAPVDGESYKLGFYHGEKEGYYYFTGAMSGYYGATTVNLNDYEAGVDVTTNAVDGGWTLSFVDGTTTKYVAGILDGTYKNFKIVEADPTVWTWNQDLETFVVTLGGEDYFMGTSGSYQTFSLKAVDKAPESYVGHIYDTNPGGEVIEPTPAGLGETPEDGESYKLGMSCMGGTYYYFTGAMNGYYGASSTTFADGVDITTVAEGDNWLLTFEIAGNTQYINAEISGTHNNFVFGEESVTEWTWNDELHTFTTLLGENTVCIGTYGSYNTFGLSKKLNAEEIYMAHLYVTEPAA